MQETIKEKKLRNVVTSTHIKKHELAQGSFEQWKKYQNNKDANLKSHMHQHIWHVDGIRRKWLRS